MKKNTEFFTFELSEAGIDAVSDKIRAFLSSHKFNKQEIIRYTLSIEEILLKYTEQPQHPESFTLALGTKYFNPFISLEIKGAAFNAYAGAGPEQDALSESILSRLGLAPEYIYKGQTNIYQFRFRKKRANPVIGLLISLTAAVIVGLLGKLLPDVTREFVLTNFFDRLHGAFLNILGCMASPMIFLSVTWGFYGIGDAATLKRIGNRLMLRYAGTLTVCVLIGAAICLPIMHPAFSTSDGIGGISALFAMLFDIIPSDIISPFMSGNTLQIIFMAMIFGIALLFLGQKTRSVAVAIEQINYIIQFIIEFITKLVPYFTFIVIVGMIWSNTASIFGDLQSLFLVFILAVLVTQILFLLFTSILNRANPLSLLKKGLPTLIIALTTASSAAAFGFNINACKNEYGIDESISSFGIPLGMVLFKPNTAICYMVTAVFFAKMYSVEISVSWIIIMLFSAVILAIATQPIPGGSLAAYTVLFSQLGIPAEAIAIALACDALFDFISTGFNQFSLPLCLLNQASKSGLVDRSVLQKQAKNR